MHAEPDRICYPIHASTSQSSGWIWPVGCPALNAAAPLFPDGWLSWRAGIGAIARMAAERALVSDPGYRAAELLLTLLGRRIDPRSMSNLCVFDPGAG